MFKRLMRRLGYVKAAEYGLELSGDVLPPIADQVREVDGPYAVGSIVDGPPVPDLPAMNALEARMLEPAQEQELEPTHVLDADDLILAEDDTQRVVAPTVVLSDDLEEEVRMIKFLEADTVPAKKI